jgi:hypothetical protein
MAFSRRRAASLAFKNDMNHVTIDLITHRPKDDKYEMILVEEGPWPDGEIIPKLRELQERLYNYVDVAVDGQLASKYPDSKGKGVVIRLECYDTPEDVLANFYDRFSKHVMNSPEIQEDIRSKLFIKSLEFEYSRGTLQHEG